MALTARAAILAPGAVRRLRELLTHYPSRRILLVTGKQSFFQCGAATALASCLAERHCARFYDFAANPRFTDVQRGLALAAALQPELIIAVGGGSVLDMAKAIALLSAQPVDPLSIVTGARQPSQPGVPLIAIPTTAGSGSESTHFAVVYIDGVKYSLAHPTIRPVYALVDPELSHSMPPRLTATTGLDALCQAIESYWAVAATAQSQAYAAAAIRHLWPNLLPAVHAPTASARARMSYGAHLAGRAIDISKTTAPHAVSYTLTMRYGVPHGHAVALTLGQFFPFNAAVEQRSINDPRGRDYVAQTLQRLCRLLDCATPAQVTCTWYALMAATGLEHNLNAVGAGAPADLHMLVANVNPERLGNHPVAITVSELQGLLENVRH